MIQYIRKRMLRIILKSSLANYCTFGSKQSELSPKILQKSKSTRFDGWFSDEREPGELITRARASDKDKAWNAKSKRVND